MDMEFKDLWDALYQMYKAQKDLEAAVEAANEARNRLEAASEAARRGMKPDVAYSLEDTVYILRDRGITRHVTESALGVHLT